MMERPKRWEQPDDIELTTLGEVRRLRWRCRRSTPSDGCEWWDPSNWGPEHPDSLPVFARNPNPPKPLEAGQVRGWEGGERFYLVGPSDNYPGSWVAETRDPYHVDSYPAAYLLALPVVEQEPREQKPRRMKANGMANGTCHGREHDENRYCPKGHPCTPVEQEGEG